MCWCVCALAGEGLLEGLVTNLFVIDHEGVLITAKEHVLEGHMRALVIHTWQV